MKKILNQMTLEILSRPENVGFARMVVAAFASQIDYTLNDLEEIKVAVSEAVSNTIIHGYKNDPSGRITISGLLYEDGLEVSISDDGLGIENVELALTPTYSTDPERMGLGFAFMQSFMDEVKVISQVNQGTMVTMWKKLHPSTPGADTN